MGGELAGVGHQNVVDADQLAGDNCLNINKLNDRNVPRDQVESKPDAHWAEV